MNCWCGKRSTGSIWTVEKGTRYYCTPHWYQANAPLDAELKRTNDKTWGDKDWYQNLNNPPKEEIKQVKLF